MAPPGFVRRIPHSTLPSAVFGTDVVGGDTVAKVTLTLNDGVLGDDTGVDGTIVDINGPVFLPEPGAMLSLFSGIAMAGWLHRRRQARA